MGEVTIKAVDGVDFVIEKGEFAIIVGPSGAGKTTVLNMLGGMDACTSGVITVDGTKVSGFNAKQLTAYRRHDIGFVFQFYNLVQNLTALENVELASQICDKYLLISNITFIFRFYSDIFEPNNILCSCFSESDRYVNNT